MATTIFSSLVFISHTSTTPVAKDSTPVAKENTPVAGVNTPLLGKIQYGGHHIATTILPSLVLISCTSASPVAKENTPIAMRF